MTTLMPVIFFWYCCVIKDILKEIKKKLISKTVVNVLSFYYMYAKLPYRSLKWMSYDCSCISIKLNIGNYTSSLLHTLTAC